jgi:hypothetical protein
MDNMQSEFPWVQTFMGNKYWRGMDGKFHRTDGPAFEYMSGRNSWYLNGEELTFDDWLDQNSGLTDEEKVMFKLQYG